MPALAVTLTTLSFSLAAVSIAACFSTRDAVLVGSLFVLQVVHSLGGGFDGQALSQKEITGVAASLTLTSSAFAAAFKHPV